jgi:hypothetical protein
MFRKPLRSIWKRSNLVAQRPLYFQKQPVASTVFKDFKDVEILADR